MMRAACVLLLSLSVASAVPLGSREQRLAVFLAGVEVLDEATLIPPQRKAAALRWLIRHTGITPERARSMITQYRERPEQWQRLLEALRAVLLSPEDVTD